MGDPPIAIRIRPDIITDRFLSAPRGHGAVKAYLSVAFRVLRNGQPAISTCFGHAAPLLEELPLADALPLESGRKVDLMTEFHPVFVSPTSLNTCRITTMNKMYAPYVAMLRDAIAATEDDRRATKEAFLSSRLHQDAILMRVQLIGEHLAQIRHVDEDACIDVADDMWVKVIGLQRGM